MTIKSPTAVLTLVGLLAACAAEQPPAAKLRTLPPTLSSLATASTPAPAPAPPPAAPSPAAEPSEWCLKSKRIYEANADLGSAIVDVLQSRMKDACAETAVLPPASPMAPKP